MKVTTAQPAGGGGELYFAQGMGEVGERTEAPADGRADQQEEREPESGSAPVQCGEAAVGDVAADEEEDDGGEVNAELPGPAGFEQASQHTRPEGVAEAISCGDDADAFVEAVRPYAEAGFTEVALVQIGGDRQEPFLEWAEVELPSALRNL